MCIECSENVQKVIYEILSTTREDLGHYRSIYYRTLARRSGAYGVGAESKPLSQSSSIFSISIRVKVRCRRPGDILVPKQPGEKL